MTLRREISWVLLVKLIAIAVIWYVWFSGPHDEVNVEQIFGPSSQYSESQATTPSKVR